MEELALEFLKIIVANKANKFEVSEDVYLAYNYAKEFTRQTEMYKQMVKYDPNFYKNKPLMLYKASIYGDGSPRELSFAEEIEREMFIKEHYEGFIFVAEVDEVETMFYLGDLLEFFKGKLKIDFHVFHSEEEAKRWMDYFNA